MNDRHLGEPAVEVVRDIQRETTAILAELLGSGSRVALLDFPSHQNTGDSLIYLGERRYLDLMRADIRYECDVARFDEGELERRLGEGTVLLRGGGNLGDRWTYYQNFRENVISGLRRFRIIQLPQSIDFRSAEGIDAARRTFGAHPDFCLLLREGKSLECGMQYFGDVCRVERCPDSAFGVELQPPQVSEQAAVLAVLRRDSESVIEGFDGRGDGSVSVVDWGLRGSARLEWELARMPSRLWTKLPAVRRFLRGAVCAGYHQQARVNVTQGVRMVAGAQTIVTDRLHAAILGCLLEKKVVIMDNANGKVSSMFRDYLRRFARVSLVSCLEEALEVAAA